MTPWLNRGAKKTNEPTIRRDPIGYRSSMKPSDSNG